MAENENGEWIKDGDDFIYRGDAASTPPPVPGQPAPPPTAPPGGPSFTTPPPYGSVPPTPPGMPTGMAPGVPVAKKKRWPWIAAGVLLFCGLPLGGCLALVGFGVNEIGNTNDEIRTSGEAFVDAWNSGTPEAEMDASCFAGESFPTIDEFLPGTGPLTISEDGISFVTRNGNTTFASNADSDTSVIPGYEDISTAWMQANLTDTSGTNGDTLVELSFINPNNDDSWELCGFRTL
jgi:hypothetical protein